MNMKVTGRVLAACAVVFAMLCPWGQPALAQPGQGAGNAPQTAQRQSDDDGAARPIVDADGFQQWKDDNVTTDEGIGWKIDAQGTLHVRPWKGGEGTTGSMTVDDAWSSLPWHTRRDDIKRIASTGTIHLNANSDLLFYGCRNLESLEGLSGWDAGKLEYGRAMFQDCTSLTNLHGLEHWNFNGSGRPAGLPVHLGAASVDPAAWSDESQYNPGLKGEGMFRGCAHLTDLTALSEWRFPEGGAGDISGMFQDCTGLTNLHGLEHWNVDDIMYLSSMSWYPDVSDRDPAAADMGLFSGCSDLADISALSGWELYDPQTGRGPNYMGAMFKDCAKLASLDALAGWNMYSVASVNSMFRNCTGLTDASAVAQWNVRNLMDPIGMFFDCPNLERIGIPSYQDGGYTFVTNNVSYDESPSSYMGLDADMPQIMREDGVYGPWTWKQFADRLNDSDDGGDAMLAHSAVWMRYSPSWILDYNPNGGVGSMPASMNKIADPATVSRCTFLRFGYAFTGWSTQPADTAALYQEGDAWRPAAPKEGAHYTLYAQWKKLGSGETGPISGDSGMLPGWVQIGSEGTQGAIPPNAVANAQFTNQYLPGAVAVTLKFKKLLDGNVPGTQFGFRLLDSSGAQIQTVHNVGAAVSFAPLSFDSAGEYTYFVSEIGTSDTIDMDTHPVEVKVTVSDDDRHEGNLKATVQLTGETTFRNTSKPASIELRKTVTGTTDTSKDFTFKVTLTGRNGHALNGTYSGVKFAGGVGTVHMRAGASATIGGIPAYTNYTVEETDVPAGYALASIDHATGLLQAAGRAEVTAENTYHAKAAVATLNAVKYVRYGTNAPIRQIPAGTFRFSLCEVVDGACNGVAEAENADDGSVTFPQLTYAAAGVHEYRIREENTGRDGVTYDTRTVTATVAVTDDGAGQLHAAVTTKGGVQVSGEDGAHTAVFVNQARQMMTMPRTGAAPWVALLVAAFAAAFVSLCLAGRRRAGRHSA